MLLSKYCLLFKCSTSWRRYVLGRGKDEISKQGNKFYRKLTGQSRIGNLESLPTFGIQNTGRKQQKNEIEKLKKK